MNPSAVLIGLSSICLISIILGIVVGQRGWEKTFIDINPSARIILFVFSSLPIYIMWWMQEYKNFSATETHITWAFLSFAAGWGLGRAFREKG